MLCLFFWCYFFSIKAPDISTLGFILENFPMTEETAKTLFPFSEEEEEDEEGGSSAAPDFVIALDAPDSFLQSAVIALTEAEATSLGLTETGTTCD